MDGYEHLRAYLNDEPVEEMTILEVGPGNKGIERLKRLRDQGASSMGIDTIVLDDQDHLIEGRWEDLSEHFAKSSVDIVYTVFMHPLPFIGGVFDPGTMPCQVRPPYSADERAAMRAFEVKIATEISRVLKPGGRYLTLFEDTPISQYHTHNYDVFEDLQFTRDQQRFADIFTLSEAE